MTAELLNDDFRRRQYDSPPVVEAIARLHWNDPIAWNLTTPGILFERVKELYPAEPQFQNLMQAELGGGAETDVGANLQITTGPQRIIFGSEDDSRRLVVGPTDISANGLPPYEGWESLESRLFAAVDKLDKFVPETRIAQVGIRYINRIEIPAPQFDFSEYMTIGFSMPVGWPGRISAFLDRAEYIYPDEHSKISFTWASTEGAEGSSSFIIDLDLVSDIPESSALSAAREKLADLKVRETAAFESLIQDRLRELFREVH